MQEVFVAVLDDDPLVLNTVKRFFENAGIGSAAYFTDAADFVHYFHSQAQVRIAIIDYYLQGDLLGLEVLKQIRPDEDKCSKAIVISSQTSTKVVIELLNNGLFKYIDKNEIDWLPQLVAYTQEAIALINAYELKLQERLAKEKAKEKLIADMEEQLKNLRSCHKNTST